jgi:hypothetical protein
VERDLRLHPDESFVLTLIKGLRLGFDLGINGPPTEVYECKNSLSARRDRDFVTSALEQEVANGYLSGPCDRLPFSNYRVSPIGVAIGKYSGKKRLILDLSSPHNEGEIISVNSAIDKEDYSLQYVTIDDAIRVICKLGRGAILIKVDVKDAFRILPVSPTQWPHLCIKWDGQYYWYVRLPFGSRSSPKIFTMLSEAIHWIATNRDDFKHLMFLLDDFLLIEDKNADGERAKSRLLRIFERLGVPLNDKKTVGPATTLEYLGIILDSDRMEARLPMAKLVRIRTLIQGALHCTSCTKRELLSLLGHLNFACRVIYHGRTFLSRLIKASTVVRELYHKIYLSHDCKEDLFMWGTLLQRWNGVSMFHIGDFVSSVDLAIFTDSSSKTGFGGYCQDVQEAFLDTWDNHPVPVTADAMSYLELYPIVVSCTVWGKHWQRRRIKFMCDNEGTVAILRKGRSQCEHINKLMRHMAIVATQYNFTFTSQWLSTKVNIHADALSRGNLSVFQDLAPDARIIPCPPHHALMCHSKNPQHGTAHRH